VTSMPRVGLNPYALGMRLFYFIEEAADKGRYSRSFLALLDADQRKKFDCKTGAGRDYIFAVRENLNDFLFVNTFLEQDFVDRHRLFVADKTLDEQRMVWQWFVKSRSADQYKEMVKGHLYHPPHITVDPARTKDDKLYLVHHFEGLPLVKDFVQNTLLGLEYLWGGPVVLETTEVKAIEQPEEGSDAEPDVTWQRVRYTMKERKLSRGLI